MHGLAQIVAMNERAAKDANTKDAGSREPDMVRIAYASLKAIVRVNERLQNEAEMDKEEIRTLRAEIERLNGLVDDTRGSIEQVFNAIYGRR